jgi:phenylpropionate dioxygenase-like ring-hydroxylating dioxygenase large terminal subunit
MPLWEIIMLDRTARLIHRDADPAPPCFHQCWYPVALADEVTRDKVLGVDFLGTRVVAYRDAADRAVVQEAWCPHLGADLSLGDCVECGVRCPYHHWRFAADGRCIDIPTGDKIPPGAKIFSYPAAEAWGLVWAFNGAAPLYDLPKIPDADAQDLLYSAHRRSLRQAPPWLGVSNGVDFQHLRTVHHLDAAAAADLDVRDFGIEYRIDTDAYMQHGLITGTNVFAQHLRVPAGDQFMLFAGTPVDERISAGFYVVGVRKPAPVPAAEAGAKAHLHGLRSFVERLLVEDDPVLNTIRFRRGVLTAADRHLARYFKYVEEFPTMACG